MNDKEMPILDHLNDLRRCLIQASIGIILGFALCYYYSEMIMEYLSKPLFDALPEDQRKLFFTNPIEKFLVFVKIGVAGGLSISSPWLFFQIWKFVSPGLYEKERKYSLPIILIGFILFITGNAFAYYVALPGGLKFLMSIGGSMDGAIITYESYFNVVLVMMLVMGLAFEIPLFIFGAVTAGIIPLEKLRSNRPAIYVGLSVIAAFLTPPDPFTMIAMFIPMALLFEMTMLLLAWKK